MDTRPNPSVKEGLTLTRARHNFETRKAIAAQPRSISELPILRAPERVIEVAARIKAQMRAAELRGSQLGQQALNERARL